MKSKIKPNTIVSLKAAFKKIYGSMYPKALLGHLLYLGDITNMPGHCALVDKDGKVHWGYHTEELEIVSEENT